MSLQDHHGLRESLPKSLMEWIFFRVLTPVGENRTSFGIVVSLIKLTIISLNSRHEVSRKLETNVSVTFVAVELLHIYPEHSEGEKNVMIIFCLEMSSKYGEGVPLYRKFSTF
jgi:hypothetical protein